MEKSILRISAWHQEDCSVILSYIFFYLPLTTMVDTVSCISVSTTADKILPNSMCCSLIMAISGCTVATLLLPVTCSGSLSMLTVS